jgi:hypothetical protein
MSAFRESAKRMLQDGLRCPGCKSVNTRGLTYIEVSFDFERAACLVCLRDGPISSFQPQIGDRS